MSLTGICGTCACPAEATAENEGYSSCCNDRIEYGEEAAETVRRANCAHTTTRVETGTAYGFNGHTSRYSEVVCAHCGICMDDAAA